MLCYLQLLGNWPRDKAPLYSWAQFTLDLKTKNMHHNFTQNIIEPLVKINWNPLRKLHNEFGKMQKWLMTLKKSKASRIPSSSVRVNESVSQWVSESVSQWFNESVSQWVSDSMSQWVSESVCQWVPYLAQSHLVFYVCGYVHVFQGGRTLNN